MLRWMFWAAVATCGFAQTSDWKAGLAFENGAAGEAPRGWSVNPPGAAVVDTAVFHGGKAAARIERREGAAGQFSGILRMIPVDFGGRSVEVRAWLRCQDAQGPVALWGRVDGAAGSLSFQTTQGQDWKGTHEWQQFSLMLPINDEARQLYFGVLIVGSGTAWADDVEVLVDGKPVWDAPKVEREKTVLDSDHEFDDGSGIRVERLTDAQTANLVTLGKVWGFLKYHHPAVTAGKRHWDFDLFRVLGAVLAAGSKNEANAAMAKWVTGLGEVAACQHCAALDEDGLAVRPAIDWIRDSSLLGVELSGALQKIYTNRPTAKKQFYVSMTELGNPKFEHEAAYARMPGGDAGFQILAAYRFWNIVEYWSPNREIVGGNWDDALKRPLPKIARAKTREEYLRELMALIALDHDTHANLWGSMSVQPPTGPCRLPAAVRFVNDQPVVAAYLTAAGAATGLKLGDVLTEMDGVPMSQLMEQWAPYYADSNEAARERDMGRNFSNGACGDFKMTVRRGSETLNLTAKRISPQGFQFVSTHDLPGDTFRLLSKDIAYLKLSTIKSGEVKGFVDRAAGTKGLVIDLRNYPSAFMPFELGSLLVDRPTPFVRFTHGDIENPGAFHWGEPVTIDPAKPHYSGRVVILIDEITQSQAEYTTMALRTAPGAKVIGSTTAGADGNVSQFPLPGGTNSMISGLGVFYPDRKPTQRVGIVPDIVVKPTIAGIRDGRDEWLEAAVREILGRGVSAEEVKGMVK